MGMNYCPPRTEVEADWPGKTTLTRQLKRPGEPNEAGRVYESLGQWRQFASAAGALLKLSHSLWRDTSKQIESKDWFSLFGPPDDWPPREWDPPARGAARRQVLAKLNEWLSLVQLRPVAAPEKMRPRMQLQGGIGLAALFTNLVMELAHAATGSKAPVPCSSCGQWYKPKRYARGGEDHFCHICGRAAAMRLASARYRKGIREGK